MTSTSSTSTRYAPPTPLIMFLYIEGSAYQSQKDRQNHYNNKCEEALGLLIGEIVYAINVLDSHFFSWYVGGDIR